VIEFSSLQHHCTMPMKFSAKRGNRLDNRASPVCRYPPIVWVRRRERMLYRHVGDWTRASGPPCYVRETPSHALTIVSSSPRAFEALGELVNAVLGEVQAIIGEVSYFLCRCQSWSSRNP
jgi:hypothetical protein